MKYSIYMYIHSSACEAGSPSREPLMYAELEITAGHRPFSEQIANVTDKSTPRSAILAASGTRIRVQYVKRFTCKQGYLV